MKKLIWLLALCLCAVLCLNGIAEIADAPGGNGDPPAAEETTPEETTEPEPTAEETQPPEPEPTSEETQPPEPEPTSEETQPPEPEPTGEETQPPEPEPTSEETQPPEPEPTGGETQPPEPEPTAEETQPPEPEPTSEETQPPEPEPTAEDTQSPEPEATAAPDPSEAPGPTGEATPEATEAPEATPEATEEPGATPVPELPGDAEAWFERDGARLGGTLAETLDMLQGGEKVYLRAKKALFIEDAPAALLGGAELLPDPEVFGGGGWEVRVSQDNPEAKGDAALLDRDALRAFGADARVPLYIWVQDLNAIEKVEPPEEEHSEEGKTERKLTVDAIDYVDSRWSFSIPTFDLSGMPEDSDWSYAAIVYDERIIPMSDSTFVASQEGVYTLRFAMLNDLGDIEDVSPRYNIWLDYTAPESVDIQMDEEIDYMMTILASDSVSGLKSVSLDGGATWSPIYNDEPFVYRGTKKEVFPVGSIVLADVAGNIYINLEDVTVDKAPSGGGGGGGGGGTGKPARTHASGEGEEGAKYDAVELELPAGPMDKLTVGGEEMDLTLWLEDAQAPDAPVGKAQSFTGTLCTWGGADAGAAPDTLLLEAAGDGDLGDRFTYEWRFNGEVYRMLANSGIRYVALKVGDSVAAFPTEGFTGGTKYTELKMLGVSTRRFDYALTMKVNRDAGYMSTMSDCDFSRACDLSIRTEVENMSYELGNSANSMMYFYDVYLGPEDMLLQPFGEYRAA